MIPSAFLLSVVLWELFQKARKHRTHRGTRVLSDSQILEGGAADCVRWHHQFFWGLQISLEAGTFCISSHVWTIMTAWYSTRAWSRSAAQLCTWLVDWLGLCQVGDAPKCSLHKLYEQCPVRSSPCQILLGCIGLVFHPGDPQNTLSSNLRARVYKL